MHTSYILALFLHVYPLFVYAFVFKGQRLWLFLYYLKATRISLTNVIGWIMTPKFIEALTPSTSQSVIISAYRAFK